LANLQHEGRPTAFGTKKKPHNLTLTEEGWNGVLKIAEATGCRSVSEFLEKLGRGELNIA
jgi:hypothetical protein